ncbi:MAG: adenylate/guanylate cyclase domain-containing protein [Candidatus Rifleibacteriota bacterium]
MKNRLSHIFFVLLFFLPVIIINTGFERVLSVFSYWQEIQQQQKARTKLGEIESYTDFSQHLLRYSDNYLAKLKSFYNNLSDSKLNKLNWPQISENCFKKPFPKHELWLFSYNPQKKRSKNIFNNADRLSGRRPMEMIFSYLLKLNKNKKNSQIKYQKRNEKLLKNLFGSGTEGQILARKHKSIVTPIIYKQEPSWLIWDCDSSINNQYFGFFIIVSRNQNLKLASFKLAAKLTGLGRKLPGGFVRLYESAQPDILFPDQLKSFAPFKQWRRQIGLCNEETITNWHYKGFDWNKRTGSYKLFTRIIPHEKHLLFILLPVEKFKQTRAIKFAANLAAIALLVLLLCRGLILNIWPGNSIKSRFFLVFSLAAILPLILYFITTIFYVYDRQKADEKALHDKISAALLDFDAGKEQIENDYKTSTNQCFDSPEIKSILKKHQLKKPKLLFKEIQNKFKKEDKKLPLVGMAFLDLEGKKIVHVNPGYSQNDFNPFIGFYGHNAVLNLREDTRSANPRIKLPEYDADYENVIANQAYGRKSSPTHKELDKFRGRVFKTKFGFNRISTFYNFLHVNETRHYALFLCWLESDFEQEILARSAHYMALNQPEIEVVGFKYTPEGRKLAFRPDRSFDQNKISVFRKLADSAFNSKAEQIKTISNNMSLVAYASPKFNQTILVAGISHYDNKIKHYWRIAIFLLIAATALFLVIIIGIITYYRIAQPVKTIKAALDRVKQDDFSFNQHISRSDEIGTLNREFKSMISGLAERKRLASILSEHAIEAMSVEDATLKEKTTKAVVLISDIRDFTTMGENYPPEILTFMLNIHFTEMSKIISKYGGKIYKFIGDAIEAVFVEDPQLPDSSVDRSLSAAVEMLKKLEKINNERQQNGLFTYRIGVGLASGEIVCGETGSIDTRLEYAMLGTPFKRAEKFEAFTKQVEAVPIVFEKKIKDEAQRLKEAELTEHQFEGFEVFSFKGLPEESFKTRTRQTETRTMVYPEAKRQKNKDNSKFYKKSFIPKIKTAVFIVGVLSLLIPFLTWFYSCNMRVEKDNDSKQQEILATINNNMIKFQALSQRALIEEFLQQQADAIADRLKYDQKGVSKADLKKSTDQMIEVLEQAGVKPSRLVLLHKPGGTDQLAPDKGWQIVLNKGKKEEFFYRELLVKLTARLIGKPYDSVIDFDEKLSKLIGVHRDAEFLYNDLHARATRVSINNISEYLYWQPILIRNPNLSLKHVKDDELAQVLKNQDYKDVLFTAGAILLTIKNEYVEKNLLKIIKEIIKHDRLEFAIIDEENKIEKSSGFPLNYNDSILGKPEIISNDWLIIRQNQKINGKSFKIYAAHKLTPKQLNYFNAVIIPAIIYLFLCLVWYRSVYYQEYISSSFAWQLRSGLLAAAIVPITTVYLVNEWNAIDRKKINVEQKRIELINYFEQLERRQFFYETRNWEEIDKLCSAPSLTKILKQTDKIATKENINKVETEIRRLAKGNVLFNEAIVFSNHCWQRMFSSSDVGRETTDFKRFVQSFISNYFSDLGTKTITNEEKKLAQAAKNEMINDSGLKIFRNLFGSDAYFALTNGLDIPIKIFAHTGIALIRIIPTPELTKPLKLFYWMVLDRRNGSLRKIFKNDCGPFAVFTESRVIYGEQKQPREGAYVSDLVRLSRWAVTNKIPISMRTNICNESFIAEARLGSFNQVMVLVGLIPEDRIINQVEANRRFLLLVLIISVLAIIFIAILLGNDFISPVRHLTNGAHNIRLQNYRVRLPVSRNDELGELLKSFNEMARGLQEKEIMGKMVSNSARKVTDNEDSLQKAEKGMKLNIAALYIAVPHFATFIETMDSKELIEDLKFQIEHICKIIIDNNGDVDKLMGEKVLAVFYNGDNIARSLEDALNASQALRNSERSGNLKFPLTIGIHTGEVLAGLLGAGSNRDFTVIGDTVNTAARICMKGSNLPRERILISASAVEHLKEKNYELRSFGEVELKGKAASLKLYQIFFTTG